MKIEDQVCSFDQSALIYSHGLRLENTLFQWCKHKKTGEKKLFLTEISPISYEWVYLFPAYTVAELGVLLGYRYRVELYDGSTMEVDEIKYGLFSQDFLRYLGDWAELSEAQARAEALIWLLDNKYLKPEELKL